MMPSGGSPDVGRPPILTRSRRTHRSAAKLHSSRASSAASVCSPAAPALQRCPPPRMSCRGGEPWDVLCVSEAWAPRRELEGQSDGEPERKHGRGTLALGRRWCRWLAESPADTYRGEPSRPRPHDVPMPVRATPPSHLRSCDTIAASPLSCTVSPPGGRISTCECINHLSR